MAELDSTIIDLSNENEVIELEIQDDYQYEIEVTTGDINVYQGFGNCYIHQISQVDIDNKYVIISDLSNVTDKKNILIFVENAGIALEYQVDYDIVEGNKITWQGYELETKLQLNDKLKVYY